MLMAGLDGIKNKLDPGKDLYDLPKEELKNVPTVRGSMREALESLDKDRALLKSGGVFDDDFIDSYIEPLRNDPAPRSSSTCIVRRKFFAATVLEMRRAPWRAPFLLLFLGKMPDSST
jgi:glutamine synthetase